MYISCTHLVSVCIYEDMYVYIVFHFYVYLYLCQTHLSEVGTIKQRNIITLRKQTYYSLKCFTIFNINPFKIAYLNVIPYRIYYIWYKHLYTPVYHRVVVYAIVYQKIPIQDCNDNSVCWFFHACLYVLVCVRGNEFSLTIILKCMVLRYPPTSLSIERVGCPWSRTPSKSQNIYENQKKSMKIGENQWHFVKIKIN